MVSITTDGRIITRDTGKKVFVYFISAPEAGLIKIGSSYNLAARLKDLQTGSPERLELLASWTCPNARAEERGLHKRFAAHRAHGEWFYIHDDILDYVAEAVGFDG